MWKSQSIECSEVAASPRLGALSFVAFCACAVALAASPASAATLVVDADGFYDANTNSCDGTDPAYTAIQDAIDDAVDGDTVFVCPGTYNENQIRIFKRITVQGSGADVTIIDAGGGFGATPFGTVRIVPPAGVGDVLFDGFTVQNPRATSAETALRVNLAVTTPEPVTVTVTNNVIIGSGNPLHNLNYGVYIFGPAPGNVPAIGTVVFQNNEIREAASNTILVERHIGPVDVSYNVFDRGVREQGISAYFNMAHSGTVVTGLHRVSHNVINLANDPGPYTATNTSTAISFNGSLTGTNVGRYENVEITNNVISGVVAHRRAINIANNRNSSFYADDGVIENAVISCNTITGPGPDAGSQGIRLVGYIPDATITNNVISGVNMGVQGLGASSGVPTGLVMRENSITDTGAYALDWRTTEAIDVSLNWWGSDTGPAHVNNPGGTGGIIGASGGPAGSSDDVQFEPWLASGDDADDGPCFVPGGAAECRTLSTCTIDDGCGDDPAPDGTVCGGGSFTCSGGVCDSSLFPMVLSRTDLKADNGRIRPNGRVSAVAIINDNDTQGSLEAALLSDSVSVRVTDSADFDVVRPLTECVETRLFIRCRSADRTVRAMFYFRPRGPFLYTMRLVMSGLESAETGGPNPAGPVAVSLDQSPGTRSDVIGDFTACRPRGQWQTWCREK